MDTDRAGGCKMHYYRENKHSKSNYTPVVLFNCYFCLYWKYFRCSII